MISESALKEINAACLEYDKKWKDKPAITEPILTIADLGEIYGEISAMMPSLSKISDVIAKIQIMQDAHAKGEDTTEMQAEIQEILSSLQEVK